MRYVTFNVQRHQIKIATVLTFDLCAQQNQKPVVALEKKLAQFESAPTDLMWEGDQLYVALSNGAVKVLSMPVQQTEVMREDNGTAKLTSKVVVTDSAWAKPEDFDDDDVDFTHQPTRNPFIDDEAADDDDDDEVVNSNPQANGDVEYDSDISPPKATDYYDDDVDDMDDGDYPLQQAPVLFGAKMPKPQAPFGPSATPIDLAHRILCWNHIGTAVWHRGEDDIRDSVDITFTDSAFSRPMRFTDTAGFILGSLGEDGGIFCTDIAHPDDNDDPDNQEVAEVVAGFRMDVTKATLKKKRSGAGSTIYFHRFESLGALRDKDWYLTLPDGERAVGCATGEGWAAVITR
jgi:chromosome transmission fidelity protein 4